MGERKCAFEGCNALEFRTSGYCLRHKGGLPDEKIAYSGTPDQDGQEIIPDPLLIPKIALAYVPIVVFLLFVTSTSDDAFAGYYLFINSGMCLLLLLPLYAVYLVRLSWRRFKEGTLTLFVAIFHILSFIVPLSWLFAVMGFGGSPA
ncbi:MAG: hypothetical protein VYB86_03925 [Candidatus Thermoplasmatota archaeon]|nr:hypothetical protein [Candidatus Thermoplasmatota archaeon]